MAVDPVPVNVATANQTAHQKALNDAEEALKNPGLSKENRERLESMRDSMKQNVPTTKEMVDSANRRLGKDESTMGGRPTGRPPRRGTKKPSTTFSRPRIPRYKPRPP